jgi:Zn-dependent M28 family amino/carboxypeptidase
VLLVAHWDHFGTCAEPPAQHLICNGAVDNASGLAVITEAARLLAQGRPPERDIYVLATSAEEYGLLGALAFAENPPIPLRKFVAVFNVDSDAIAPAGTAFAIVGRGRTGLDPEIERVVRKNGRQVVASDAANAYLKRQDGWIFLQHDVPAVMVSTAYADTARLERFMETRYHRPSDQATADMELGGAADDVRMLADLARDFADTRAWPGAPPAAPRVTASPAPAPH